MKEVLQKIIAQSGLCSRREAENYIKEERVKINGNLSKLGDRADIAIDKITIDGKEILLEEKVYFAFYKPSGVVTTLKPQKNQRSIITYLPKDIRVFPVGRLDSESEGLLLLTNDGNWANKIMHPRYEHKKKYLVEVDREINFDDLKIIKKGVIIEHKMTASIDIVKISSKLYELTLIEGRNRIIRKIMEKFGHKIKLLKRTQIECILLKKLKEGEFRHLSKKEINYFL